MLKAKVNDVEPWLCPDNILRRCVVENEILKFWRIATLDHLEDIMVISSQEERSKNTSSKSEMPQKNIQVGEVFDIWGLEFLGTFPDSRALGKNRFMQLNELGELRDRPYENTKIYEERSMRWYNSRLRGDKDFKVEDKVLLFNSHFKMHLGKLKSKWYDPNTVKIVYLHGAVENTDKNGFSFKVNGQRLKKYYEGDANKEDDEVIEFEADPT
nr:hypothetical protein [Tanacetum cinerariifolium]